MIFYLMKNYIKTYENILINDISYKLFMRSKPLCIRFYKIDGFTEIYDGNKYLQLLSFTWFDKICNRILNIL